MSRLHALVFKVRAANLHRQADALRRRAGLQPHVPSVHLVPCYPLDPVVAPELEAPARLGPWFFAAALVLAFAAGCMVAGDRRPAPMVAAQDDTGAMRCPQGDNSTRLATAASQSTDTQ